MAAISVASLLFTAAGLVFVAQQISDTRRQATGQFLFELDSQFQQYVDLQDALMDGDNPSYTPTDWPLVWRYLGLFERCKVLIDNHTIDMKTFEAFYGYRLYSVVANTAIRKSIASSHERHQYFIRLCNQVLKYKKARGLNNDDRTFAEHIKNFEVV
jgi:hypothetical protein